MPRGGARPGAGRKKKKDLQVLHNMIDARFADEDWRRVLDMLIAEISFGGTAGLRAAEILWRYRFGLPAARAARVHSPAPAPLPAPPPHNALPRRPTRHHSRRRASRRK
ncbi:MAG TPA: hypothetical protein VIX58_01010 [Anaerolineae bacterium]